jgi:hypothetical protein
MPILRQRDMIEALGEPVDDRHDRVAVADCERAARTEIVLHVDDEQQILIRSYLHICLRQEDEP